MNAARFIKICSPGHRQVAGGTPDEIGALAGFLFGPNGTYIFLHNLF